MSLEFVLESFGAERDPADPKRNWRTQNRDRVTVTGNQFFNHDQQEGGGGAIDLAAHLLGYSRNDRTGFMKAVKHLSGIDLEGAINQYVIEGRKHAKAIIDNTPKVKLEAEIPPPSATKLPRVVRYLTEHREIPPPVVEKEINGGRLYADNFGNAVFRLTDPNLTGKMISVELRGTLPDKPFHGVRGEEKGFYFAGSTKSKVAVFVEAGVDALSLVALHPDVMAVATVGARRETMQLVAQNLVKQGFEVRSGFDLDKTGNQLTNSLKEVVGESMKRQEINSEYLAKYETVTGKKGKDWNDALKGHNAIERERAQTQDKAQQQAADMAGKEHER